MSDPETGETAEQRLHRNFAELLQELRVAQTGVQILFAFLLTLPFSARFSALSGLQHWLYIAALVAAAVAAATIIAPVSFHRLVFRQGLKEEVVQVSSRLAQIGIFALMLAIIGAILLVVDVVAGLTWAVWLSSILGVLYLGLWYVLPAMHRFRKVLDD
ncbi:O-antigen/teichoic acid export membrane protein [Allocatelliglobosispora scoriae]|uniref:O-antigen/teichoic acid export membrane protein n=1 Tax=Allocatelliglobosispora scoriae TaxID=643052 RepID=A0A841BF04_9ACTN|nr:DUF6328 family protein [Allocatelliglobosispora scoriae]MBB5867667.1 O-antigen/teichoic acid export membrane protein [Allocatelliglobosispora scoriae]